MSVDVLKVVVYSTKDDDCIEEIANSLKLPIVKELSADTDFYLSYKSDIELGSHEDLLSLTNMSAGDQTAISVNFSSGATTHRREQGGGKNQALGKAIGLNKNAAPFVLDATAGLAKDAFVMATLGCNVKMVEQSPIVGALLQDGLNRGLEDDEIAHLVDNMCLIVANSVDYMRSDSLLQNPPDVVYLDPMYPERKKSAKVKKEMQTLQQLLGHQDDLAQLLDAALACAKKRVVVKRPKGAKSLSASFSGAVIPIKEPTHTIESKKTRYDVYMCV